MYGSSILVLCQQWSSATKMVLWFCVSQTKLIFGPIILYESTEDFNSFQMKTDEIYVSMSVCE